MKEATKSLPIWQGSSEDMLTDVLRRGAQKLLEVALNAEVEKHLERYGEVRDAEGHRIVVRNGFLPERILQTGIGPVSVCQPRVEDRQSEAGREKFSWNTGMSPPR